MGTITSNQSGAWSSTSTWVGGVVPVDNDAVVIAASHDVLMDVDQSAFTGLQNVTINGGVTPGKLYWANGTSGVLKIRTGYALSGTLSTNRGRLVATSDGGFNTTTTLTNSSKALIILEGTARIDAVNLDIRMYPAQPTLEYVHTYGSKFSFNAATGVTPSTDIIDLGVTPPAADTAVLLVVPDGSTCPGGLLHHGIYYVRAVSDNTCKLAGQNADASIIDITSVGSGTIHLLTGYASGSAVVNVLEDVTGDPVWSTATGFNHAVLADLGPYDCDQQRLTLSSISASSITLSAAVDSPQFVGAILALGSRNAAIFSSCTTAVNIVDYGASTHTGGVLPAIISTSGTGTTFYGNGSNGGIGNIFNGPIAGCGNGSNGGIGNIFNGPIAGCNAGSYGGIGNIYNGTIAGCSYGSREGSGNIYNGTIAGCSYGSREDSGNIYNGTIAGCSNGSYYGSGNIFNGPIAGCGYGSNSGSGNIYNGTIAGCSYGSYSCSGNIFNGTIAGCICGSNSGSGNIFNGTIAQNTYDFRWPLGVYYLKSGHRANYTTYGRNTNKSIGRVVCEDYGGVIGAQKVIDAFGDILRAPCDGVSDRPSGGPTGASGDCIEVSSVQSLCSVDNPLLVLDHFKVWIAAGITQVSFPVQTNYAGVAAGNLRLDCSYLTSATEANRTIATASPAIAQRADNADWSQQLTVAIDTAVEGWIECSITLMEYQAGCEVYIWPVPTVS